MLTVFAKKNGLTAGMNEDMDMSLRRKNVIKRISAFLIALLLTAALLLGEGAVSAYADDSSSSSTAYDSEGNEVTDVDLTASVEIYSESESENVGFHAENVLPGYSETQYFRVRVYYEEDITVHYVIDITDGMDGILAEILNVKIVLVDTGEVLYEGLFSKIPEVIDYTLETDGETTTDLYYAVTAWVDGSVGNEYANKSGYFAADFYWWVAAEEVAATDDTTTDNTTSVKTGDDAHLIVWGAAGALALIILIYALFLRRRKDRDEEAGDA